MNTEEEYDRLIHINVEFSMKSTAMRNVKTAILNDTCGNKIQLNQMLS